MTTTITTEILSIADNQIVARLTRPEGFTMPAAAAVGLLRAEVAKFFGVTPKDLEWYAEAPRKVVTPTTIEHTFVPSVIRRNGDGSLSYSLPSSRGQRSNQRLRSV